MLKFILLPQTVKVEGDTADIEWLDKYLSLFPTNVYHMLKHRGTPCPICKKATYYRGGNFGWWCSKCQVARKGWDGSERFYNKRTKSFSIGFWPQIKRALKANNRKYKIKNRRESLEPVKDVELITESLYGDQIKALNRWLKWGGRGIAWCAPGFGKTELAMGTIKVLFDRKLAKNVLFVVNGLDGMLQTRERINKQIDKPHRVRVINIQALSSSLKKKDLSLIRYLRDLDFLIIDECHHGRAVEFKKLIGLYNGKYRLGISASPFHEYKKTDLHSMKSEDATVLKLLGPVVARYSATALIRKKRLAKPIIFLYRLPMPSYPMQTMDQEIDLSWPETRKLFLVQNRVLHKTIARFVQQAAEAGEQSLVVAGGVKKLAYNIWKALELRGVNVRFLHGGVDKQYRNWARKQLIKGGLEAICATTIYDEALDLPNLRLLVFAYGGLSDIKIEQRTGRDLRHKKGSDIAVILDFICTSNRHLKKHSYARLKHFLNEEAFEFCVVGQHSPYVNRLLKDRARFVDKLPDKQFFEDLKNGKWNADYQRVQTMATN